jgi:hypothetical protein
MSGLTICVWRGFTEGAAPNSHPGTTFAALGRDSGASALAGRSSVDRLVYVAASQILTDEARHTARASASTPSSAGSGCGHDRGTAAQFPLVVGDSRT